MKQKEYEFFWGGVLSNFHPAWFTLDEMKFSTSEQAFMMFKAAEFGDMETAVAIMKEHNPGKCKRLGRKVKGFDDARWKYVSMDYMERACYAKFDQNLQLGKYLVETGDKILVEASPWDTYWGIGMGPDDHNRFDESKWRGENKLGIVLMRVREQLCNKAKNFS